MTDDRDFMAVALDLAKKGQGFTSPNPMVGAVVVKDNRIIGKGYHEAVGEPHSEVNAINDAGDHTEGAILYVTLEPCNHTGRTRPCTEKILSAGIRRVVVAMKDPNPDVKGGGNDFLKTHGVDVTLGVCEVQAQKLNEAYIKYVKTKRPFVIVKCASTLDGRIATKTGDAKWISNELSRNFVHTLRHAVDAVMVGIDTVTADNPSLTTRLPGLINGKKGRDPVRIILDTQLSIAEDATVLKPNSDSDTLIITGDLTSNPAGLKKKRRLLDRGIKIVESPLKNDRIDLNVLMDHLGSINMSSLLIEGGGHVIASALSEKIGDKVLFFYAPKILAADDGVPICRGNGPEFMSDCIPVKDIDVRRFGDDVMIAGYIEYSQMDDRK